MESPGSQHCWTILEYAHDAFVIISLLNTNLEIIYNTNTVLWNEPVVFYAYNFFAMRYINIWKYY